MLLVTVGDCELAPGRGGPVVHCVSATRHAPPAGGCHRHLTARSHYLAPAPPPVGQRGRGTVRSGDGGLDLDVLR